MRILLVLLFLSAATLGGYYGYQRLNRAPDVPRYLMGKVERGTVIATVLATGVLEPVVKVLVSSRVSGNLTKWYKDFNDPVKAGDLLAELDQDRIQSIIAQRKADLIVSKARVAEAAARVAETTLQLKQIENAFQRSASSPFEVETARIAVDAARAAQQAAEGSAESAEAQLRAAEVDLTYTRVYSPIDGIVISRDIDAGQTVAASLSAPTLFTIAEDLKRMRVKAAVSETDIGQVREGMPAAFRVDAYPDKKFAGTVRQVRYRETVVSNIVTYETLIEVENPDLLLRPGMTASITFEVQKAENVLTVPNAALRFDPNATATVELNWAPGRGAKKQPRVFRLVGEELKEFVLKLGITDGSVTEVFSEELKPGDEVVTERILPMASAGGMGGPGGGRSPFNMGGGSGRPRGRF